MCWWLHFVQAATCPPSASVRQASIADITLSWLRLICPVLARRHAGPYLRKISAISSVDLGTRARTLFQSPLQCLILQASEHLIGTDRVFNRFGGHMGILRRGR